jgi:hypothetical protein
MFFPSCHLIYWNEYDSSYSLKLEGAFFFLLQLLPAFFLWVEFFNRYTFLDSSVGISSLFEISSDLLADDVYHILEAQQEVQVPGIEGLFVPSGTRGRVLKVVGEKTALVRWEVNFPYIVIIFYFIFECLL